MASMPEATLDRVVVPLGEFEEATLEGIIVPLTRDGQDQTDICQIMSEILDCGEHTFAPTGILDKVDMTPAIIRLPDPVTDRFDFVIPLRRCRDRRNCLRWDSRNHEWEKIPFHPLMNITGHHIMILAALKPEGQEVEEEE